MKKILIIALFVLMILPVSNALTASIGNSKAVLRTEASPDNPAIFDRTILVRNTNDVAVKIDLTPVKPTDIFLDIKDDSFELQPGEEKQARYVLTMDRGGTFDIKINVGFQPLDPDLEEASVGLSASILVISEGPEIPLPEPEANEEDPFDDAQNIGVLEQPDESPDEDPVDEPEATAVPKPTGNVVVEKEGASPLVGVGIILGIIVLGIVGFLIITKLNK